MIISPTKAIKKIHRFAHKTIWCLYWFLFTLGFVTSNLLERLRIFSQFIFIVVLCPFVILSAFADAKGYANSTRIWAETDRIKMVSSGGMALLWYLVGTLSFWGTSFLLRRMGLASVVGQALVQLVGIAIVTYLLDPEQKTAPITHIIVIGIVVLCLVFLTINPDKLLGVTLP